MTIDAAPCLPALPDSERRADRHMAEHTGCARVTAHGSIPRAAAGATSGGVPDAVMASLAQHLVGALVRANRPATAAATERARHMTQCGARHGMHLATQPCRASRPADAPPRQDPGRSGRPPSPTPR